MSNRPPEDIRLAFTSADRYLEGNALVYTQHTNIHEHEAVYVIVDTLGGWVHEWYGEEMVTFPRASILEIVWRNEEDNVDSQ